MSTPAPPSFELTIERLSHGGRGVGRHEGIVVFVPNAAVGDRLKVKVKKKKRRHLEAEIEEVLVPGPGRQEAPCPVFGRCGGCAWQHLAYGAQLEAKEAIVRDAFVHQAGIPDPPVAPILGSPEALHYRNKMEFAFDRDGTLGLHPRGFFHEVIEIEDCLLAGSFVADVLAVVRAYVKRLALPGYDKKRHEGYLRHLVVREGQGTGERLVALVTEPGTLPEAEALVAALLEEVPGLQSVLHVENDSQSDVVAASAIHVLHGRDHIFETLAGHRYALYLPTFFQTNSGAAEVLVGRTVELAALEGSETVLDVFCGVGAFSLPLARQAKQVWGVEIVPEAIEAAKKNAERAGLTNTSFHAGDARRTLPLVLEEMGQPDLVLLDPPRSGAGGKVMRRLGRSRAPTILYVSCNPTTLAPDLKWLFGLGYRLESLQPVDLFPQTWHVETIALLRLDPDAPIDESLL
ncbi:MAG: 23S rRNA (uracil(1939)-C(5))-methyltransferase RlmD [Deltaproteobacteria bacterium]|nr:23S rRNA (uracil(1939)-C(5))-methyltransferase RlmD [Deltaproteobacteria bacterium]